jgi:hypothetical protein
VKRLLFALGLLTSSAAYAEAGKGLSRISMGEVLLWIFLFGFAIPAGLGALVYAGLKLINKDSTVSLGMLIFVAVLLWWLGWGIVTAKH